MKKAKNRFFLSVTEECILNPCYYGFRGGRVEVFDCKSKTGYNVMEFRFFVPEFMIEQFREMLDFKELSAKELKYFRIDIEGGRLFEKSDKSEKCPIKKGMNLDKTCDIFRNKSFNKNGVNNGTSTGWKRQNGGQNGKVF